MTSDTLEAPEIVEILRERFGAPLQTSIADDESVRFVPYDAFAFEASPEASDDDAEGGNWDMGLLLADGVVVSNLLGEDLHGLGSRAQVDRAVAVIDQYCRLRLDGTYLQRLGVE